MVMCFVLMSSARLNSDLIKLPIEPDSTEIVSLELASQISFFRATKEFGNSIVIADPIICYDLFGSRRSYIFTVKLESGNFPSKKEILKDLCEARQLLPEVRKELAKVRELSLNEKRENITFRKDGDRYVLIKNPEWDNAEKRLREIENQMWGIGKYATIVVSARKDIAPILEVSNTLPYYYTYRDMAEKMAQKELSTSAVSLKCFYYESSLDQIFEFESSDNRKVWIGIFPPRIVIPGKILATEMYVTEEEKRWIEEKWQRMMEDIRNEK
jgi:hypothetical protein